VDKRFDNLTAQTNQRFDTVDKRFDTVDKRFDNLSARLDRHIDIQTHPFEDPDQPNEKAEDRTEVPATVD